MQWIDIPHSEMADRLKAKTLEHPTNAAFDDRAWQSALASLENQTERDIDLTKAAVYLGKELASLRETGIPLTTEGFNRPRLIRLMVAFANQQFLTLRNKYNEAMKTQKKVGIFDMERAQQMFVDGAGGQKMTPDDLVTDLVDSLPHWLFHIWRVADDAPSNEPVHAIQFAARANEIVSIEHSLRQLWLHALWIGTTLVEDGDALIDTPRDRALAERWFVFDQRERSLMMSEHGMEAGARVVTRGKLPPAEPAISRTVIRIGRPPSGNRQYITGKASGAKLEQREHVNERDMLDRLYTGLFMDEKLPKSSSGQLTCRLLSAGWWVLQDLARLAVTDLGRPWMADDKAVGRFALTADRKYLCAVLSDCLSVETDRAMEIVDWFTCDPSNTGRLFAKSVWSEPLVPEPDTEYRHIVLAPLLVGSPVKRVEAWMERGGISDNNGIKGRGKPFERHVRKTLKLAILDNPLLLDTTIAEHGLKRKGNSEEIDLLIRIGNTVIVGEVKCFVAPSEPLEKYNHLKNLSYATDQASDKLNWANENRELIAHRLDVSEPLRISALAFIPVVILNHGFGTGLERNNVPIVDLHYLRLLMTASSYVSNTRFERDVGAAFQSVDLYKSEADLEANLDSLLRDPPPLRRFTGTLRWRRIPFQTSDGRPFYIELPALI